MNAHKNASRRLVWTFVALAGAVVALAFAGCMFGSASIPLSHVLRAFQDAALGRAPDSSVSDIVFHWRLPKALAAIVCGIGLSICGLQMQALFRNPLAGPDVLGVSAGASLGVAISILLGGAAGSSFGPSLGAFSAMGSILAASLGSAGVLLLAVAITRRVADPITVLVLGLMLGSLAAGGVGLLVTFSGPLRLEAYLRWMLGSFDLPWRHLAICAPVVLVISIAAVSTGKSLNAWMLGRNYFESLGEPVGRVFTWLLVSSSLIVGAVTAYFGPIAFLGIAAPHLARAILRTADHRVLLPGAALTGAVMAQAVDLLSRLPGMHVTMPVNTVSGLIGAPVVIWVVLKSRRRI